MTVTASPPAPLPEKPPRRRSRWPNKPIGLTLLAAASWPFMNKINEGDIVGAILMVLAFAGAALIVGLVEKALEWLNRR